MRARECALRRKRRSYVSEERDKMGAPEEKFANDDDVEAHKLLSKMGEPDEKFETDEDDVEAHMLGSKNTPKNQP
jgi:hypothetical protein